MASGRRSKTALSVNFQFLELAAFCNAMHGVEYAEINPCAGILLSRCQNASKLKVP